jgi:type IV secretory pathway VirB4 component
LIKLRKKRKIFNHAKEEKLKVEENSKSILEENQRKLKDLLSSDTIDFETDPRYAIMGDQYYMKNLYVGFLPESVLFASFLHELYSFGNIETSISIDPIDTETAKRELSKARTNFETEVLTSEGSNRTDDMASKTNEASRLRAEIRDGLNKLYNVTILSTIYDKTLRGLNNNADQLKSIMGQTDIGIRSAVFSQEDVFRSNKPLMINKFTENHIFDKRSLACIFPFTSGNLNHIGGVPIGVNKDNGLPVIYNNFSEELSNYNFVIFAESGGGKSSFMKALSSRSATLDVIQNFSIDVEPEYNHTCLQLGGEIIRIAYDTETIINFFDIEADEIENKITKVIEKKVLLQKKIDSVTGMIMTMAKGQSGKNKFYDDTSRELIRNAVVEVYRPLHITDKVESLYEDVDSSEEGLSLGKIKKQMPTFSDFYRELKSHSKSNVTDTFTPYYDYLLLILKKFSKEENGTFTCFDGQSTVKITKDIPFVNFDVSELNEETELPIAQHIICEFLWEQVIKKNNKGHKIRMIIDEAWRLAPYEDSVKFLVKGFRRARKKNTSFVVVTQQFDTFYTEDTKPIIENSATKLFLPPDDTSLENIAKVFKLKNSEAQYLKNCIRGEGLLKVSSNSIKLKVEIPDFEWEFIETNQNKINKRVGA